MTDLLHLDLRWGTQTSDARLDAVAAVGPDRAVAVGPRRVLDVRPRRFVEHQVGVRDLVAVAAGDSWVAASSKSGRIWQLDPFAEQARFPATDAIVGLTPLGDGEWLAVAALGWVRVLSTTSGERVGRVRMPADHTARCVVPNSDETQLYVHADLQGYTVSFRDGPDRARWVREELERLARRGVGPAGHVRGREGATVFDVPFRDAIHRVARDPLSNKLRLEASHLLPHRTIPCVTSAGFVATVSANEAHLRDPMTLDPIEPLPVPEAVRELPHVRWLGASRRGHAYTLHSDREFSSRHGTTSRIVRWHLASQSARVSRPHPACLAGAVHEPTGVVVTLQADHTIRAYDDRSGPV